MPRLHTLLKLFTPKKNRSGGNQRRFHEYEADNNSVRNGFIILLGKKRYRFRKTGRFVCFSIRTTKPQQNSINGFWPFSSRSFFPLSQPIQYAIFQLSFFSFGKMAMQQDSTRGKLLDASKKLIGGNQRRFY